MDHDGSARIAACFSRTLAVRGIWIRDVERQMKAAFRVLLVEGVLAFGSFVVALVLLRLNGTTT
jgi:hypothetical protein